MRASHILLAVAVAAVWGFNFVAIKVGLRDFPPLLFSCLRFALAALPVLVLGWRNGPPVPWRFVIGIGVMLGVVKFPLLYLGIDAGMPAGLASLVLQSQAFFTAIFAAFMLGDRPGPRQIGGMAVAFAGVGLIALEMPAGDSLFGLGLTLAAAAAWGVSNIVMKRAKAPDLFSLMVWVSLVPPLPVLAMSLALEGPERIVHAFATLTVVGVGSLLYISVAATLFGFAAWGFLMRHYPASLVAPFSLLVPIFGMSSSALLLGETFTAAKLAGGLLVFAGLALSVLKLPLPVRARA
ncbi:EamA family transporter [Azospirillum endophyticum]